MHKYRVSAYLCGHDHNLQHIAENYLNHTVHYFVSGAANMNNEKTKNSDKIPKNSLKFAWTKGFKIELGGLALIKVDQTSMNIKFIRSINSKTSETQGKLLYKTEIYPRNV